MMRRNSRLTTSFRSSCILIFFSLLCQRSHSEKEFQVGVILDMGSWNGKMVHSCITMAASDFYNLNDHYQTRIVPQTIDSKGDPLKTLEAAQDLVRKNVGAIIVGPEMSLDATLLALLGEKAKLPIFSLGGSLTSSNENPYFLQVAHSEAMQFRAIAALVESFQWTTVNFICEDTEYKSGAVSHLFEYFQEKSIQIAYTSLLPSTISDDGILAELHKLMNMQTTIFVLHMTPSLASRLVSSVKSLGMMGEGYAWFLTDKTRNLLHSKDCEKHLKSMEGSLTLKPYVQPSIRLQNFTSRWKKEFQDISSCMNVKEISAYGLWAYDAIWVLAGAVEGVYNQIYPISTEEHSSESNSSNLRASLVVKILLNELVKIRLKGISGDFQIVNRTVSLLKAFEIVNVIREGERRVGFWEKVGGITSEIMHPSLSRNNLKAIIWPGGSVTAPSGAWPSRKKLRVGVPKNSFNEFINLEHDNQTNTTRATGFCVDVFEATLKEYKVPVEYIPFVDANGEKKGTYNDLVYQIYLEKYDAVVGDVTITGNRSQYAEFTIPYTEIGVGTIARVKTNKDMWMFTKPIGVDLCLMTAVFFILNGIVIWIIEKPTNKEFQGSPSEQIGTIIFSTLFLSSREKLSSNLSRFVMLIWVFLVLILTSSYTATLASLLTVQQIELASKGAVVGYQSGNSLVESNIGSNLNFMDYKLRPYNSAKDYAEALSKGSKHDGVDGIIDEIPYIKAFLSQYSPDYAMVNSASTTNGFGFAFRKGSPLVPVISREIARFREDGTLEMLEKKWYKKPQSLLNQEALAKPQVLKVDRFGGLYLISGISLGLALVVIMFNTIRQKLNIYNYIFEKLGHGNLAVMMRHISS